LGATHYFTGIPCKRGHVALRKTKGVCVECMREDDVAARPKRKDYFKSAPAVLEAKRRYYEKNREVVIARAQARSSALLAQYRKAWKVANPDLVAADCKNRRRKHRHATPKWLTSVQKKQMREMYLAARRLTKSTGVPYVVDHIEPLRGDDRCGLHVPWNLQVITREANLYKSNKVLGVITPEAKTGT
jgi:hypothetical protein